MISDNQRSNSHVRTTRSTQADPQPSLLLGEMAIAGI
jgi:hypothetical protein